MSSICCRCARYIATGAVNHSCAFSKANSAKCDRCRDQKSPCVALPDTAHVAALELLAAQDDLLVGAVTDDEVRDLAIALVAEVDRSSRAARSTVGDASSPLRPSSATPRPAAAAAPAATTNDLLRQLLAAQNQTNALLTELLRRVPVSTLHPSDLLPY
ncbi:hypothetical protein DL98DRAFT_299664 [Cadophora sp. DSE1049]|nr:hypothetical protein DL98DRAFT_299664 [Cadophora sp. DSE1049]